MKYKQIISFLISICCLILSPGYLVGCRNNIELENNDRYEFNRVDDKLYLVLHTNLPTSYSQLASVNFDSVKEFIDTVTTGNLTDFQLEIANNCFEKDSNGIIICDFTDIQIPVYPKGFEITQVYWEGQLYSFSLDSSDGISAYYHYQDEETYNYYFEKENLFSNENITITNVIENQNSTEYYYSTASGNFKSIRYTLTSKGKELIVHEKYRLYMNDDSIPVSNEIPSRVTILGNNSGKLFYITIFDLKTKPTQKWLSDFDIKPYK